MLDVLVEYDFVLVVLMENDSYLLGPLEKDYVRVDLAENDPVLVGLVEMTLWRLVQWK